MDVPIAVQGWIRHSITADLNAFAATRDWAALFLILPLGIAFGAVHALTPGHGKTVLASYLVGSRLAAIRGFGVAGALALTHVGLAVVLALTAAPPITRTLDGAGQAPLLEALSRGLQDLIGLWLLVRAVWGQAHRHHEGCGWRHRRAHPYPLTLFAMFLALTRGVPEAGLMFALSMFLGVSLTLAVVAGSVVLVRTWFVAVVANHGASIERLSRLLEGITGAMLIAIGIREIWP